MSKHARLLKAIKSRQAKQLRVPGILTPDCYLREVRHCLSSGVCKRYFPGGVDVAAAIKEASAKLAFSFDQELKSGRRGEWKDIVPAGTEIPPGTLMVLRNTLTTNKEDRDGDVLETSGALPDPKMPLLWQHLHAVPIGKTLGVVQHTDSKLTLATALLDLNELTEDCAKLFDANVLRFSHGFRALEFEDRKGGGFRVTKFEIIEQSAVSVPSNTGAEVEALAAVKLNSELMKSLANRVLKNHLKRYSQGVGPGEARNASPAPDKTACGCGKAAGAATAQGDGDVAAPSSQPAPAPNKATEPGGEKALLSLDDVKGYAIKGYCGMLAGSFAWIHELLQADAARYLLASAVGMGVRDWVYIVGVFDTYAIVAVQEYDDYSGNCNYYSVPWAMVDGEPNFNGDPVRVDLVTTTEVVTVGLEGGKSLTIAAADWATMTKASHAMSKRLALAAADEAGAKAGRALSAKNADLIAECVADLEELKDMEIPRAAKALCTKIHSALKGLVDATGKPEDDETEDKNANTQAPPKSLDRDTAIGRVLAEADSGWLRKMAKAIEATASANEQNALAKELIAAFDAN